MDAFPSPPFHRSGLGRKRWYFSLEKMMTHSLVKNEHDRRRELIKKHGNASISTLRRTYGKSFAPGMPESEKLSDVIHQLDKRSLLKLARESHDLG
jgi:hypothetical protein